jgi:hypothetical protein
MSSFFCNSVCILLLFWCTFTDITLRESNDIKGCPPWMGVLVLFVVKVEGIGSGWASLVEARDGRGVCHIFFFSRHDLSIARCSVPGQLAYI